jgi:hypothetical protein
MEAFIKIRGEINDSIIDTLKKSSIIIEHVFTAFSIICIKVDDINVLDQFDFIDCIELDEEYEVQKMNIYPNIRINKLKAKNLMGSSSVVGIIDSGMTGGSDLKVDDDIICSGAADANDAMIDNKLHGTVVGRIVKYIAPWSRIVNLKVANDQKLITKKAILKALDCVYTRDIRIVNMSLGRKGACSEDCMVCGTVNQLRDQGYVIVTSIGNYGDEGIGVTACPGNAEKAFTIGAVNANKKLADYSSVAPTGVQKPDVLAPGSFIVDKETFNGTSFATPFVTGMIAASADKFDLETIVDTIVKTARTIGLPYNEQGNGLVHIEDFLEVLESEKTVS